VSVGEWRGTDTVQAVTTALRAAGVPDETAQGAALALVESHLIVRTDYYVPEARELFGLMRQLSYWMKQSLDGYRWVMCRETFEALVQRYTNVRVPTPTNVAAWVIETNPTTDELADKVMNVIEGGRYWGGDHSMLFGLPIRIDPAARSPLFELDSAQVRGGSPGSPN